MEEYSKAMKRMHECINFFQWNHTALCVECLEIIYRGADYLNLISPVGFKKIKNNIQAWVLNLSITKVFRCRCS